MNEQFKQILKNEEPKYSAGIPIVVESYALMQDRKTGELSAQITFRNISENKTQDLVIDILCKNAEGKKTEGIFGYSYLEPYYKRDQKFGEDVSVLLPDESTRSIEVNIKKVAFVDGSEITARVKSTAIPVQQRLVDYFEDNELAQQYVRETNLAANFVTEELNEIWLCSCGAYNSKEESRCHACMLDLQVQKKLLSADTLKPRLVAYEKEQVQIKKQQAEEKRLQKRKAARTKKLIKTFAPIGALVLVCAVIWITVFLPLNKYNDAWDMLNNGSYEDATVAFRELENFKDSARIYQYLNEKRLMISYGLISEYDEEMTFGDIRQIRNEGIHYKIDLIETGSCTVGLRTNGTVFVSGMDADVSDWKYIIDISAGFMHVAGLGADGSVVVAGRHHEVRGWSDIVAVQTGSDHTVGLKAEGTVVAAGKNDEGQCNVQNWRDITAIFANGYATIGIKADGSVVATGLNKYGEIDIESWQDIVSISMSGNLTLGLRQDGSVVAAGDNSVGQCDTQDWSDIVSVAAGTRYSVGLKSDGSVVATGLNNSGQCDVQGWSDIVMISAGRHHVVGLQADGNVVAAGSNEYGQCNVMNWEYIVAVYAGEFHTVAIEPNGTVIDVGKYDKGGFYTLGIELW